MRENSSVNSTSLDQIPPVEFRRVPEHLPCVFSDKRSEPYELGIIVVRNVLALKRIHERQCLSGEQEGIVLSTSLMKQAPKQLVVAQTRNGLVFTDGFRDGDGDAGVPAGMFSY